MKRFLLFFMILVVASVANAQDVIVKNDGSTVLCKIVEVNKSDIVYLKWSDLSGPKYIMDRSLISNINYQDGRQEKLNEQSTNVYAPGNQQNGMAQYNDNALLAIDMARHSHTNNNYIREAHKLKILGWSLGGSLVLGGSLLLIIRRATAQGDENAPYYIGASIMYAGGIATTMGCLISANKLLKKSQELSFIPVIQQDYKLCNGKLLTASIDIIRDYQVCNTTMGLGIKFNF